MNILALGKGMNRSLLERACQDLCADPRTSISYTALKHRLTVLRAEANARPTVVDSAVDHPTREEAETRSTASRRDTSKAYLAGASAFSLAALAGSNSEATSMQQGADNE